MLLSEYEERMGTPCDEKVYIEFIHPMYMMCLNLDKDAFCDEMKIHGHSRLLCQVAKYAIAVDKELSNQVKLWNDSVAVNRGAAELLLGYADRLGPNFIGEARQAAVDMIGEKAVALFKLNNGLKMSPADVDYITENLA